MGKHAYLIMAHNNFDQLRSLLRCLDDERNDIYLHVDAGCKNFKVEWLTDCMEKSNLDLVERIRVKWGGFSLVKARYILLNEARDNGPYDYYHFISGADLPLYSQETIHLFFDQHKGEEFISIGPLSDWYLYRILYYHPFRDFIGREYEIGRFLNGIFNAIQKRIGVNRIRNTDIDFYIGEEWFSVTERFVDYALENYDVVKKYFHYGDCTDEMVFPTLYMMWQEKNKRRYVSDTKHSLFSEERMDIVRAIDWTRGNPYTFRLEDYDMLLGSGCLFARKFDSKVDNAIIEKIVKKVLDES